MPTASIHGTHLHYDTRGTGSPLLLLLPQSSGPAGRRALVDGLAKDHRVITFAPGGSGGSGPAAAGGSMADMAANVVELLDALDLDTVALVCHSTGCGIGLCLSATHPERVRALVLATPWTHADPHLHTMQTLRKAAARALDPEQYARFNAALLFPPAFRRANEPGFARMAADAPARPQDAGDIARRLDAILAFDARPLWPRIRCGTLVVGASDDQLMPPWFATETARGIDAAELHEFGTGGHMLPETRTVAFTARVLEFLARASQRGGPG